MIQFPVEIGAPSYPMESEPEDRGIISPFEDGSQQSRAKFTRSRRTWTVSWAGISVNAKKIFENFYRNTTAGSAEAFVFVFPPEIVGGESETVKVRFSAPPKFRLGQYNQYTVDAVLKEV